MIFNKLFDRKPQAQPELQVETESRSYEIQSGRSLFLNNAAAMVNCLKYQPAGLILDLGAAIGGTSAIYRRMSPNSRIIAFEPYSGNWPHFDAIFKDDPLVTLIKKAVANDTKDVNFHVGHVVKGDEDNWTKGKAGYSSIGRIVDEAGNKTMKVPTCRVDDVVAEQVNFMKLDIQGGEYDALLGANTLIDQHGVNVIFCEFSGDIRVLDFLGNRDYILLDNEYLVIPPEEGTDLGNWSHFTKLTLSTGRTAYHCWPNTIYSNPIDFANFINEEKSKGIYVQTDLVAIRKSFFPTFLKAVSHVLEDSL